MKNREVIQNKNTKDNKNIEHSKKMNDEAVEKIKKETAEETPEVVEETKDTEEELTQEEAEEVESIFFEDDEVVTLRDGKKYPIAPCTLKDARKLMQLLKVVNVDAIILNFAPTGDDALDDQRQEDIMLLMEMAFKHHKHIDRDYIDEYVDLDTARYIIDIMIGLNGLKK